MAQVNSNYLKLKAGYLFPEIARRVMVFQEAHPKAKIIRLGIGDVVLPLPQAVCRAMAAAVGEMGKVETFKGYGPERGYDFLIHAIIKHDYESRGITIKPSEIFISDGSKCDSGNIQEIFGLKNKIAVTDPVYPVYVDTQVMAGRTGDADQQGRYAGLVYMPATVDNDFCPALPKEKVDLIYLCSPNNPTGAVLTKAELKKWVDYARKNKSVILFDAAYESFIRDPELPHSIYEIKGAEEVAIELRSFSKNAGFTGTRCAFMVIPSLLKGFDDKANPVALNPLWARRHTTKFNGVPYIIQKGAAACYTPEGKKQIKKLVDYTMENASVIRTGLTRLGLKVYGGVNAPYLWVKTSVGMGSWEFFDKLLVDAHVVGTPGAGFGPSGEGYLRLSAFGLKDQVAMAISRIKTSLKL